MKSWELAHWPPAIAGELEPQWYDAAEALMRKHVTTGSFQEGIIAQLQALFPNNVVCDTPRAEHQPNLGKTSFIEQSTGMFSTAELLYDALTTSGSLGRENLFVNLNHLVTRLESSNGKITEVVCQDLIGNCERSYHADNFVLAAGSIESPRIALRSGLTNPNSLTGVGLTDHGSWFSKRFVIPPGSPFAGVDKHARIFLYADPNAQHRFNTEVELNDDYWRVRHSNTTSWEDYVANKQETYIKFKCTCATPLINENFVQLNADPDDKVRVRMPRCPFGPETRPAVELLLGKVLTCFGVQGYDLTQNDQLGFGNEGTPHHAGGTMRISANQTGVVNADLRHEAYTNLYVCDASVLPFIAAANPSLTLVALGMRLADHLK
jgi:choline dehydrogenase-like flavoprotein